MSASNGITDSFKIIPQNVRDVLTNAKFNGKEVRANNEPVFKGTFAEKQGAVLNDLKRLSYARKVRRNDTGGKTGFSRFLKIIGNILHNFRSHFYSSEKALADLKRDVQTLEKFGTSREMTSSEYTQLKGFLTEIKQINRDNEASVCNAKNNIDECLNRYDKIFGTENDKSRREELVLLRNDINNSLSDWDALKDCVEKFKGLNPFPEGDKRVSAFRERFLTDAENLWKALELQWGVEFSLGDRLEQIIEKQAKRYEELHNTPKNA